MAQKEDLTGKKFGNLTVIGDAPSQKGASRIVCRCDCGNVSEYDKYNVKSGKITRCHQCTVKARSQTRRGQLLGPYKDVTGQRFGRLVALKFIRRDHWLFRCDCGKEKIMRLALVQNGEIQSCGCLLKETAMQKIENNVFGCYDGTMVSMLKKRIHGKPIKSTSELTEHVGVKPRKLANGEYHYQAVITLRGKTISLGTYDNLKDAIDAREKGERKYFAPLIEKYEKGLNKDCDKSDCTQKKINEE